MSVFQTLKQRNANVTKTIVNALLSHPHNKKMADFEAIARKFG